MQVPGLHVDPPQGACHNELLFRLLDAFRSVEGGRTREVQSVVAVTTLILMGTAAAMPGWPENAHVFS